MLKHRARLGTSETGANSFCYCKIASSLLLLAMTELKKKRIALHYHHSPPQGEWRFAELRVRCILNATFAGGRAVAHMIFGGSRSSGPEIMWKKRPKQAARVREECAEGGAKNLLNSQHLFDSAIHRNKRLIRPP